MKASKIFQRFCLEKNKDGILFINSIPILTRIENIAKQFQMEIWLEIPLPKGNPLEYIR